MPYFTMRESLGGLEGGGEQVAGAEGDDCVGKRTCVERDKVVGGKGEEGTGVERRSRLAFLPTSAQSRPPKLPNKISPGVRLGPRFAEASRCDRSHLVWPRLTARRIPPHVWEVVERKAAAAAGAEQAIEHAWGTAGAGAEGGVQGVEGVGA
eukprot:350454-Chlamydomonas_euryale.AAC.1